MFDFDRLKQAIKIMILTALGAAIIMAFLAIMMPQP